MPRFDSLPVLLFLPFSSASVCQRQRRQENAGLLFLGSRSFNQPRTVCGVYIAQNYDVPNIKKLTTTGLFMAKLVEEKYRKPKSRNDGDD
ncbi:hypothetical protein OIU74_012809 [Salix koriyanagi]|uniref:Secreted protein n=1 Tax=Salix koriyanagi TaxID=2511006 RepID=A0A9Q0T4X6_9ROSI|nr:hypothetical protein OIU74_012809 [Salix koriyanagi]